MEKPVESVEKCEFSTGIPGFSKNRTGEKENQAVYIIFGFLVYGQIMLPWETGKKKRKMKKKVNKSRKEDNRFAAKSGDTEKSLLNFHKFANGMIFLRREILKPGNVLRRKICREKWN